MKTYGCARFFFAGTLFGWRQRETKTNTTILRALQNKTCPYPDRMSVGRLFCYKNAYKCGNLTWEPWIWFPKLPLDSCFIEVAWGGRWAGHCFGIYSLFNRRAIHSATPSFSLPKASARFLAAAPYPAPLAETCTLRPGARQAKFVYVWRFSSLRSAEARGARARVPRLVPIKSPDILFRAADIWSAPSMPS